MSDIVLSASVRQNLLSLQSTADLLATTQNRLSTGNKVNTALDNPTNYFTAQSLNNRSSDINNLLDGVSNGVQVLQAANTGITSLQKLIDSAKSVANQALQATVGYSQKSTVTSGTIDGVSADNLLGTGAPIDSTIDGTVATNDQDVAYTANTGAGGAITGSHRTAYVSTDATAGATLYSENTHTTEALAGTALTGLFDNTGTSVNLDGSFQLNGKTITIDSAGSSGVDAGGNVTLGSTATLGDLLTAVDTITGNAADGSTPDDSAIVAGQLQLRTGTGGDLTLTDGTGTPLAALGVAGSSATRTGGIESTNVAASGTTKLNGPEVPGGADALSTGLGSSDYLIVNGKTITFNSGLSTDPATSGTVGANTLSINVNAASVEDVRSALQTATGGTVTFSGGKFNFTTGTAADIDLSQSSATTLGKLGLSTTDVPNGKIVRNSTPAPQISGNTLLSGTHGAASDDISSSFQEGDSLSVNGNTISFVSGAATGDNQISLTDNVTTLLQKIDHFTGASVANGGTSSIAGGKITLHTGVTDDLKITSSNTAALSALGLGTSVTKTRDTGASALDGKTLSFGAIGNGTSVSVTFGDGTNGTVKTLNDLNESLSADNLQASIDTSNHLVITTTNDAASQTIGSPTGSATAPTFAFSGTSGGAPVKDPSALSNRSTLVDQYNNILDQIKTTAQDASYNGIDLLNGDQLKLTFNETGSSTLKIQGVNFDPTGLGLSKLTNGTDFVDNSSVNDELTKLGKASDTLRTEASSLGSNLSIVQIRQDFSKNLINVLQTGASNLTLADTNEEAANSQALSTRQSIAVSALGLANQSQQSVLQLLR